MHLVSIKDIAPLFKKEKSFSSIQNQNLKCSLMVFKLPKNNKLNILIEQCLVMLINLNLSYLEKRLLMISGPLLMRINLVNFLGINSMEILMKLKILKISFKIWSIISPKTHFSDSFNFLNKFTMILTLLISSLLKDTKSSLLDLEIFNSALIS